MNIIIMYYVTIKTNKKKREEGEVGEQVTAKLKRAMMMIILYCC